MRMNYSYLIFLNLLISITSEKSQKKINTINIHLPASKKSKVIVSLQGFEGCYNWKSSQPSIIDIKAKDLNKCSNAVQVQTESEVAYNGVVWLTGIDSETGEELRCEGHVSEITRLEILTKQRTVEVGDFEEISLLGFDKDGNVFSSLEGLIFNWKIDQEQKHLSMSSFKDAKLEVSDIRQTIEDQSYFGDIIVVRGESIGLVKLKVFLKENPNVSASVDLFVMEHFLLQPEGNINTVTCSFIQYKLFVLKNYGGNKQKVEQTLPNLNYKWELIGKHQEINLNDSGKLQIGKLPGDFEVQVSDSNNNQNRVLSKISVRDPDKIEIYQKIYDQKDKNIDSIINKSEIDQSGFQGNDLELEETYIVWARVLINDKPILMSQLGFLIEINEQFFNIIDKGAYWIIIKAKQLGKFSINVKFISQCQENQILEKNKLIRIHSKIKIISPRKTNQDALLVLIENGKQESFKLYGVGGSGDMWWKTSDIKIFTVNQIGNEAEIKINNEGEAWIILQDRKNQRNEDRLKIKVDKKKGIFFFEKKIEFIIQKGIEIPYGLKNQNQDSFVFCESNQLEIPESKKLEIRQIKQTRIKTNEHTLKFMKQNPNLIDTKSFDLIKNQIRSEYADYIIREEISEEILDQILHEYENYEVCGFINIQTKLKHFTELNFLDQKLEILAGEHLEIIPIGFNEEIHGKIPNIIWGSTGEFILKQNDFKWPDGRLLNYHIEFPNKYQENLIDYQSQIIDNELLFKIKCKNGVNDTLVELDIVGQNTADSELLRPVQIKKRIVFRCADPIKIKIEGQSDGKISLRKNKEHPLSAQAYDINGKPFWKNDSLIYDWTTNSSLLGKILSQGPKRSLNLNNEIGNMKLKVQSKYKNQNLEDEIDLYSLDKLELEPQSEILVLYPGNQLTIKIINGSGNFKVNIKDHPTSKNDSQILKLTKNLLERKLIVEGINQGISEIEVIDIGIGGMETVNAIIEVVSIDSCEYIFDKNPSLENEQNNVTIKLMSKGRNIPQEQLSKLPIKLQIKPEIQILKLNSKQYLFGKNIGKGEIGIPVGIYQFSTFLEGNGPISGIGELQVSERIVVIPKKINTSPECVSYFKVTGGPITGSSQNSGFYIKIVGKQSFGRITQIQNDLFRVDSEKDGIYQLNIELVNKQGNILSQDSLIINIEYPNELMVKVSNSMRIHTEQFLFVIPLISGEEISPGFCPFFISLKNNSPEIVSSIQLPSNSPSLSIFVSTIKALKSGSASFFIFLQIISEKYHKRQQQINKNVEITIIDSPIQLFDKTPCQQDQIIILPPNSSYNIQPNQFKISIISVQNVTQYVQPSMLNTFSKIGIDILLFEQIHNIQIPIIVQVANPFSIFIEDSQRLSMIAPLTSILINILFINQEGIQFISPITNIQLNIFIASPSVAQAEWLPLKNQILIHGRTDGKTLLYIYSSQFPQLTLTIPVTVGPLLQPQQPLYVHIGGSIWFQSLPRPERERQLNLEEEWSSSDYNLITIDKTGHSHALGIGNALITLHSVLQPSANITITRIEELRFSTNNPKIITNILEHSNSQNSYEFIFESIYRGANLKLSVSPLINQNLNVECFCSSQNFQVIPINKKDGIFGCELKRLEPIDISRVITLTIQVSSSKVDFKIQKSVEVEFYPKFIVKGPSYINLSKNNNKFKLEINTIKQLNLIFTAEINPFAISNFNSDKNIQTIIFEFPSSISTALKGNIVVEDTTTRQKEQINVNYDPNRSYFSYLNFESGFFSSGNLNFFDIIIITICIILLFIVLREMKDSGSSNEHDVTMTGLSHSRSKFVNYSTPKDLR